MDRPAWQTALFDQAGAKANAELDELVEGFKLAVPRMGADEAHLAMIHMFIHDRYYLPLMLAAAVRRLAES